MFFDFSNALASFQDYITKILTKKLDIFVIVYFNYILIYIKDTGQSYVEAVWWVIREFQKQGSIVNLKNCHFY